MGKPIVATDADGLLDVLTDGHDALIVPKRDAAALADAIVDADRATGRGARGSPPARGRPAPRYDIDAFVRKMERLYVLLHETSRATKRAGVLTRDWLPDERADRDDQAPRARLASLAWRARRRRPSLRWRRAARVGAVGRFPERQHGFNGDEATYYSLGHSLADDCDFAFRREDLVRVWQEFPGGPEGIFLKRGSEIDVLDSRRLSVRPLGRRPTTPIATRLYYGKSFIYPLFAAPFVWLFGTNGFLVFHALLLTLCFACAYRFLSRAATPLAAADVCVRLRLRWSRRSISCGSTPDFFNFALVCFAFFFWCTRKCAERRRASLRGTAAWRAMARDIVAAVCSASRRSRSRRTSC